MHRAHRSRKSRWIQRAIRKPGALSRQLGIAIKENIPMTLLRRIKQTPVGKVISNPTKKGKKRIKVTGLLKRRVNLAITLKTVAGRKR